MQGVQPGGASLDIQNMLRVCSQVVYILCRHGKEYIERRKGSSDAGEEDVYRG